MVSRGFLKSCTNHDKGMQNSVKDAVLHCQFPPSHMLDSAEITVKTYLLWDVTLYT